MQGDISRISWRPSVNVVRNGEETRLEDGTERLKGRGAAAERKRLTANKWQAESARTKYILMCILCMHCNYQQDPTLLTGFPLESVKYFS